MSTAACHDCRDLIGGYVLGRIGRRARVGDTLDVEGRKLRVTALDGLRVAKVWLSKPKDSASGGTEDENDDARR